MANALPEQAGFHPDAALTPMNDCGSAEGPPTQYTADDLEAVMAAIPAALDRDGTTD